MTHKIGFNQWPQGFFVGHSRTMQSAYKIPKLPTLNRVNT